MTVQWARSHHATSQNPQDSEHYALEIPQHLANLRECRACFTSRTSPTETELAVWGCPRALEAPGTLG